MLLYLHNDLFDDLNFYFYWDFLDNFYDFLPLNDDLLDYLYRDFSFNFFYFYFFNYYLLNYRYFFVDNDLFDYFNFSDHLNLFDFFFDYGYFCWDLDDMIFRLKFYLCWDLDNAKDLFANVNLLLYHYLSGDLKDKYFVRIPFDFNLYLSWNLYHID